MQILGLSIANLSEAEIHETLARYLAEPRFHRVVTLNPEFIMLAQKDIKFSHAVNAADIRLVDGVGIEMAFSFLGEKLKARVAGADLMGLILEQAQIHKLGVYLATRMYGLSTYEETKTVLLVRYPGLRIEGADYDIFHSRFEGTNCEIVLCNFGVPDQELFLASLRETPGPIRLAMGVGGSFDYLTGHIRRAPLWMRRRGLEWLWRLVLQPWRWKRIWNSVVVFPWMVWQEKRRREKKEPVSESPFKE